MTEWINIYGNYWAIIETVIVVWLIYLFFKDPIRRWSFFGYIPTAILVIFDPKQQKTLLIRKTYEEWFAFSQGRIPTKDMSTNVESILQRELGLNHENTCFNLRFEKVLGTQKIHDKFRIKRETAGMISLRTHPIGKGYIACFINMDLSNFDQIKGHLKKGYGIAQSEIFTFEDAQKKLFEYESDERTPKKKKMYVKILKELENHMALRKTHLHKKVNGTLSSKKN